MINSKKIKKNELLALNNPQQIWIVKSGALAMFTTLFEGEEPQGSRRYLFGVNIGEALFGATLIEQRGLLAIALQDTELILISLDELIAKIQSGDQPSRELLSGWIRHWEEQIELKICIQDFEINHQKQENIDILSSSLIPFNEFLLQSLNGLEITKKEEQFRRFQEREKLNRQVAEAALETLTGVLHPQKIDFFAAETPLLMAAGVVGHAMGIIIHPPTQFNILNQAIDPLEAIANASQFRTRRVLLTGDWWIQEYGPLLGYMSSDKTPVALLPDHGNSYILFNPIKQTRTRVTKAIAQMILPEGFIFYRPLPPLIHHGFELFQFGVKGYEKNIITIISLGILATLLGMVTPQATAILVNYAIPDGDRLLLGQIGLILVSATLGKSAFSLAQAILSLRVENGADNALQPAVWDRLLNLKPAFFRRYSSGDLLTRLMAVSQIRQLISGATQRTLLNAVFSLLNLGLMGFYSWKLALVGVGLTLISVIFTGVSSLLLVRQERLQETTDGEINGLTVELINGVSKLRVAKAEERAFAVWAKKYSQRLQLTATIKRLDDRISVLNEILPLVSSMLIFGVAILLIKIPQSPSKSGLNIGTFLAFNAAFGIFISGVTDLSNTLTDVLGIVPLWERAKLIVQGTPEVDPSKTNPGQLTGKIVLDRVSFRYQDDQPLILNDISIQAEPGEFIAIVGPSGSGKSTLLRLLLGFETPERGTIYYDHQDLAKLNLQAVRRQLGVVLQNNRINSGSIFDNITCGALVTLNQAWEAAQMAGLAPDIEQMPMGMHTVISEGGTNLSGGQRQRLLIARALILKPKIVLLDEATSALDNLTQKIVSDSLEQLKATRIVIAHRLSTIRNADRIYVLDAGQIVEIGTFEKLVNQKGLFARLVARQLD